MVMNRRKFLKISGSAGIIVAAGGLTFAATRTPSEALKPWENAGSKYSDPMRRALSYAILAPNPHNRQPWVVDIKNESEAILTCDLGRLLPATDPFSRQIVIGLGCFLELFIMAAAEQGYRANIRYFPDGEREDDLDQRPIAHLSLRKQRGLEADALFAQVLNRHTNRNAYDMSKPVSETVLQALQRSTGSLVGVGTAGGGKLLSDLRILTKEAMHSEIRTPEAYQESIDLMRIGRREIETNPDGISLGGAFMETLKLAGVLSRENLADPASSSFQIGLDMMEEASMSSMGFAWITTMTNDRSAQIEAGRAYMRLALRATADGLAMQPVSQSLQEYPEMETYYQIVHDKLTQRPGERVQMLARLGYAKDVGPSPRWSLQTRLKES